MSNEENAFKCPECGEPIPGEIIMRPGRYDCKKCCNFYEVPSHNKLRFFLGMPRLEGQPWGDPWPIAENFPSARERNKSLELSVGK